MPKLFFALIFSFAIVLAVSSAEADPMSDIAKEHAAIKASFKSGAINQESRDKKLMLLRAKAKYLVHKASPKPDNNRSEKFPGDIRIEVPRQSTLDPNLCQTNDCLTFIDIHEGRFNK